MIFGNIKVLESCACLHWSPSLLGSVVLVSCLMAQGAIALAPPFYLLALSTRMSTSPSWFPNNHSQLVIRASKPCSSTMKPLYQPVCPWSPCPCSKPETFVVSIYQSVAWSFLAVVLEQIHQRPMQPCSRFDGSIYAAGCRSARNQGVAVQMELSGFDWAWNEMAMVNCAEQTMQGRCLVVWVDWLIEEALVKWLIRGQQRTLTLSKLASLGFLSFNCTYLESVCY